DRLHALRRRMEGPAARQGTRRASALTMKRILTILLIIAAIGAGAGAIYVRRGGIELQVMTSPVTRGDIVDTVGATGTLQAVTTVQVGSQVSGNISWLGADFNSIVKKGQVI